MKAAADKIFELELKLNNYESGYVPQKRIKIENNQFDAQSNSQWNASQTGAQDKPHKKKLLELNQDVIDEIGVEGARKWHRDVKQHKYMEL